MIKKFFKGVFTTIKVLFFIVLFAYVAFVLTQKFTNDGSVFGYRIFTVASESMRGVYDVNDVIAIKDWDPNKLKVGDDIAYRGEEDRFAGKLIIHRIVKIEKNDKGERVFYTKGIHAEIVDPAIEVRQVLGKCVGIVPIITQINHAIYTKVGFILLVICPIVLLIIFEVIGSIKEKKKKKLSGENSQDSSVVEDNVVTNEEPDSIVLENNLSDGFNNFQNIESEQNDIDGTKITRKIHAVSDNLVEQDNNLDESDVKISEEKDSKIDDTEIL